MSFIKIYPVYGEWYMTEVIIKCKTQNLLNQKNGKSKRMEYDEMMFLANMKRKAKVEFENNLWKQRFKELNGFPMEEGLGKENIIMPFSENDYLENKTLDKVTE